MPIRGFRRSLGTGKSLSFAEAQFDLGIMYGTGQGVPQDHHEAGALIRKAADQGLPVAEYTLARIYRTGIGVPQDFHEAAEWYRKAAARGIVAAQTELNAMSNKN
jgi:TPR repeat protein